MRILIAGGGIGGMAAAVAVRRAGFDPVVFEQAPAISEVGGGISVYANGMKALTALGADRHVRELGCEIDKLESRDAETGERLFTIQLGQLGAEKYGDLAFNVHRADLLDALIGQIPDADIRVNSRVVGIEERSDSVAVRLANGQEVRGDLLVGADGLRSTVRTILFGEQKPRYIGYVGWRTLVPRERMPDRLRTPNAVIAWWKVGYTVMYPVRNEKFYNVVAFVPADEGRLESWTAVGDPDELRRSLAGSCKDLTDLLGLIDHVFVTAVYFRNPLESWGTRRITLLGDAAHPIPPSAAAGAAASLEDAVTLGGCLQKHGRTDFASALSEYAQRRIRRTTRILETGRATARIANQEDPAIRRARNGRFRGMLKIDPLGETSLGWIHSYDVAAALKEPVEAVPASAALPNLLRRLEARHAFELWRDALSFEDRGGGWFGQRAGYDRFLLAQFPSPAGIPIEEVDCNGVKALKVGSGNGPALLYLHGGGFVMGSAKSAVEVAARIAKATGGFALIPDYRLAPENPYPAALDDAVSAWRWLAAHHRDAGIYVSGNDAGGGLAASLALRLRDEAQSMPAGLIIFSPMCDLTLASPSIKANAARDPFLSRDFLTGLAGSYIQDSDPRDPMLSPLYADLRGLPRMLIYAAADEVLRDDSARLAEAAKENGVDAEIHIVNDTVHSFVLFDFLPETRAALERIRNFTR